MDIPQDRYYTKDHEWVLLDGTTAKVGVTDHAQRELGDVVYVDIDPERRTLDAEQAFGTIEAVKTISDLFMPVKGKIIEINAELEAHPELVNADPYGTGWMIRIEINHPEQIKEKLMNAEAYQASL